MAPQNRMLRSRLAAGALACGRMALSAIDSRCRMVFINYTSSPPRRGAMCVLPDWNSTADRDIAAKSELTRKIRPCEARRLRTWVEASRGLKPGLHSRVVGLGRAG